MSACIFVGISGKDTGALLDDGGCGRRRSDSLGSSFTGLCQWVSNSDAPRTCSPFGLRRLYAYTLDGHGVDDDTSTKCTSIVTT